MRITKRTIYSRNTRQVLIDKIMIEGKEEKTALVRRTVINMTGRTVPITNTETSVTKITIKIDNVTPLKRGRYLSKIVMSQI